MRCAFSISSILLVPALSLALFGCGSGSSGGSTSTLPAPDFTLSINPTSISMGQGGQATFSVVVTPANGFNGNVTLVNSMPAGINCASSSCTGPATVAQPYSITLSASSSAASGTFSMNVTGTSGSTSHQATLTINVFKGDFSLTATPSAVTAGSGGVTPALTLATAAANGFSGSIHLVPSFPGGFSCGTLAVCDTVLSPGQLTYIQLVVDPSVAPGTYTVAWTGASTTLQHQTSVTVTVTAPSTPKRSASGFVSTSPDPYLPFGGIVYDKLHDLIFASHPQLGEVEVVSPKTLSIVKHIPVPQPVTLDISLDSGTVFVGTTTQSFYEIDTARLQVVKQIALPANVAGPPIGLDQPNSVASLADGTVLISVGCGIVNPCSTATALVLFDPSNGTFSQPIQPGGFSALRSSPDHQHVYTLGSGLGRYDVASHSLTVAQGLDGVPWAIAIKPDNSGAAVVHGSNLVSILDSNLNIVATYNDMLWHENGLVYSPDGSILYVAETDLHDLPDFGLEVFDAATLKSKGNIPAVQSGLHFYGWDGNNRLLGLASNGVGLADATVAPYAQTTTIPVVTNAAYPFTPDHPVSGSSATTLNGANFSDTPLVTFNGLAATSASVQSSNNIAITAPPYAGADLADVAAFFPNGTSIYVPQGYVYHPVIQYTDGGAAGQDGNSALTLYGAGFDKFDGQLSVSVGGRAATITRFVLSNLTTTVPAGTPGNADITLTTPIGSVTVPGGFTYLQRSDAALPSSSRPFQMILDKRDGHLVWTDYAANTLVVYSNSAGQVVQTIPLGAEPAGLSITPDGAKIFVALFGSAKLDVFDSATFNLLLQVNTPTTGSNGINLEPIFISAVSGGNAFLLPTSNCYCGVPVFEYSLSTNSFREIDNLATDEGSVETSSSDGLTACVGGAIWTAETNTFVIPFDIRGTGAGNPGISLTLNDDGSVLAGFRGEISRVGAFYNRNGVLSGYYAQQSLQETDSLFNSITAIKLNSTGSLAYQPEVDRIRIYDVRHGNLLKTIMIPDGLNLNAYDGIVVDPAGQVVYVLTNKGVSTFTSLSDPLSIGEVLTSGGQLTLLGSGFAEGMTVKIDGTPISATVTDSQHAAASLPSLSSASHNITLTLPSGTSYSLDNAMTGSTANPYGGVAGGAISTTGTVGAIRNVRSYRSPRSPRELLIDHGFQPEPGTVSDLTK